MTREITVIIIIMITTEWNKKAKIYNIINTIYYILLFIIIYRKKL